jgi:hypothetical protein
VLAPSPKQTAQSSAISRGLMGTAELAAWVGIMPVPARLMMSFAGEVMA